MCDPQARPELVAELAIRAEIYQAFPSENLKREIAAIESFLEEQFGRMPQPDTQEMN